MDEEGIMYLAFCSVIMLISLSLTPKMGGGVFTILAAFIVVAASMVIVILNFADYIAVSIGFSFIGLTFQPAQGYLINKEQKAVIKSVGGLYYATGYVSANLYGFEFKQEMGEDDVELKMTQAPLNWEQAVTNIGFPFKYHVVSSGLNIQDIRDELEGKRSYQEYQLSKVMQTSGGSDTAIAEIQRKINVLQRKIDRISGGEKAIGTVMYLETTAIGISEKSAVDTLERQISGLQISMSPLNVDLQRVIGRELYTLFKFNFSLPLTQDALRSYFDKQS